MSLIPLIALAFTILLRLTELAFLCWGVHAMAKRTYRVNASTIATGSAARTAGLLHVLMIPTTITLCLVVYAAVAWTGGDVRSPMLAWWYSAIEWTVLVTLFCVARRIARSAAAKTPTQPTTIPAAAVPSVG